MTNSLTLLEKIKKENELRFFFQKEAFFYMANYPKKIELQNRIANAKKRMNSSLLTELITLKKDLKESFTIDYLELYPTLFHKKNLHQVTLTLKEHLRFNKELIPLYIEVEESAHLKIKDVVSPKKSPLKTILILVGLEIILFTFLFLVQNSEQIILIEMIMGLIGAFLLNKLIRLVKLKSHNNKLSQVKKNKRKIILSARKIERYENLLPNLKH